MKPVHSVYSGMSNSEFEALLRSPLRDIKLATAQPIRKARGFMREEKWGEVAAEAVKWMQTKAVVWSMAKKIEDGKRQLENI